LTRSERTCAPCGTPCDGAQELPYVVEKLTGAPAGLHTMAPPLADTATVPPPVTPAGSCPAHQLPPAVVVTPMCCVSALPTRTITSGRSSAKSMLVVDVRLGVRYIIGGTAAKSSWRKPPMSPSAEYSGAPTGGLARSSTAVSSRPRTMGRMVTRPPLSQLSRFSLPYSVAPVPYMKRCGLNGSISIASFIQPSLGAISGRLGFMPNVSHGTSAMSNV
jgi:hypothetical protein